MDMKYLPALFTLHFRDPAGVFADDIFRKQIIREILRICISAHKCRMKIIIIRKQECQQCNRLFEYDCIPHQ